EGRKRQSCHFGAGGSWERHAGTHSEGDVRIWLKKAEASGVCASDRVGSRRKFAQPDRIVPVRLSPQRKISAGSMREVQQRFGNVYKRLLLVQSRDAHYSLSNGNYLTGLHKCRRDYAIGFSRQCRI